MIYAGTDLKYKVTSQIEGFSFEENDFSIAIKNRWGKTLISVSKDECFVDSDGDYYFTLEGLGQGAFFAYFTAVVPDNDYDKLTRSITDRQLLVTIGGCQCSSPTVVCQCEHKVHYTLVWTANLDDGTYLVDKDGNFILTSDGKRICFTTAPTENVASRQEAKLDTLTGEEFKQLIEQITQDGKINTIPELMAFIGDIPEDTSLLDYIQAHSVDPEAVEKAVDEAFEENRVTPEELATFEV